jgi:hypothetical protein
MKGENKRRLRCYFSAFNNDSFYDTTYFSLKTVMKTTQIMNRLTKEKRYALSGYP